MRRSRESMSIDPSPLCPTTTDPRNPPSSSHTTAARGVKPRDAHGKSVSCSPRQNIERPGKVHVHESTTG